MAVVSATCPSAVCYVASLSYAIGFQISKKQAYQHYFGCGSCLLIFFPMYLGLSYRLLPHPVDQRASAVPPSGRDGSPSLRYILRWAPVSTRTAVARSEPHTLLGDFVSFQSA